MKQETISRASSLPERTLELRRAALNNPLDTTPLVELGFLALADADTAGGRLHFQDALTLDTAALAAKTGMALADYLDGEPLPSTSAIDGSLVGRMTLPVNVQQLIHQIVALNAEEPDRARSVGLAPSLRRLAGENLTGFIRRQSLFGVPRLPPVGRERELLEMAHATRPGAETSCIVVAGPGVEQGSLHEVMLPNFVSGRMKQYPSGSVWQATSRLTTALTGESAMAVLEDLRIAASLGHLLIHGDLSELYGAMPPSLAALCIDRGCMLWLTTSHELEKLTLVPGSLPFRARLVYVRSMGRTECRSAFQQWRGPVEDWIGKAPESFNLDEAVVLADHYIKSPALPESALRLLEGAAALAEAEGRAPSAEDLRAVAARTAGLPIQRVEQPCYRDPQRLSDTLYEYVGSQRPACMEVARAIAARCSPEGIRSRPERPDAAFLFAGPAGVGKNTMARAIAMELYGPDRLLLVDLASIPGNPAYLLGIPEGDPAPGQLSGFLMQKPFSVIHLEHCDQAPPAVLTALANLLNNGYSGTGEWAGLVRRAIFILSVDTTGPISTTQLGFLQREDTGKPGKQEKGALSLLSDELALLRTLLVVPFNPLTDEEYAELVRRRIQKIAVERLHRERGIVLTCDEAAIEAVAKRVQASGLSGERLQTLVEQLVLVPLWSTLTEGVAAYRLVASRGRLSWVPDRTRPRSTTKGEIH